MLGLASSATFATVRTPGTVSYGQAASEALRDVGVDLFSWQEDTLSEWLEVDPGTDALTRGTAVLICPRRNGKSLLIVARILYGIVHLGELRWTYSAHRMDTAREIFDTFRAILRHPLLEPLVAKTSLAHGKEAIAFTNGGRFTIRTRTGHGGRGLECDGLVLDEALILDPESIAALTPLVARAAAGGRGQIIYASSSGSNSEESRILLELRDRGRERHGTDGDGMAFREYCADRLSDPADPETWTRANPSLGTPILSESFLRDARSRMSVEAFAREHLGIWSDSAGLPVIDPDEWRSLTSRERPEPANGAVWLAFDLAPDRTSSRCLAFYRAADGRLVVSVIDSLDDPRGIDSDLYAQRIVGLADSYDPEVIGFDRLTGAHVEQILSNHGWKARLRPMTAGKMANGLGTLKAAVRLRTITHDGHADLADDLGRATGKMIGDGAEIFSRKSVTSGPIAGAICLQIGCFLAGDELLA